MPALIQEAIKKLRGETYFEVPCLFKAKHEATEFTIGDKALKTWKLTKPSKDEVVGKIFQIASKSIYGTKKKDAQGDEFWDGIFGQLDEGRDPETGESVDSLGPSGLWLKLTVTRPEPGQLGWPEFTVSPTRKGGALPQELIDVYMSEENYPNIPKRSDFFRKDNAAVANKFKESHLYKELTRLTDWRI